MFIHLKNISAVHRPRNQNSLYKEADKTGTVHALQCRHNMNSDHFENKVTFYKILEIIFYRKCVPS